MDRRGAGVLITGGIGQIRAHLDQGAPWDACDAFREAIAERPHDGELLYWGALAHARAGAAQVAHALLDEARAAAPPPELLAEIASLRGRLLKDAFLRAPEQPGALALVERARAQYRDAYGYAHDAYPGINAATLSKVLGDGATAAQLARDVMTRVAARAERSPWDIATEAEALLLQGDLQRAGERYADACAAAGGNAGMVAAMRRQLCLLARAIPEARDLLPLLRAPDVVAFAGHTVDAPDRPVARFPAALVPPVAEAIRAEVARLHAPIVFTSAACGADLLFIDAALERGAEVNVVLPFAKADFVRTSVAVGGDEWLPRFEAALERATRVIMATDEGYLDDDVLFEHAAILVEGFSLLRAAQVQASPVLLCVIDPDAPGSVGGTRSTLARWTMNIGASRVIDLRAMRGRMLPAAAPLPPGQAGAPPATSAAGPRTEGPAPLPAAARDAPAGAPRPPRTLKSMLFADFAGYSRLRDVSAPLFQRRFLDIGAELIAASARKPLEAKTWGDALYAVFAAPDDGAEFALRFLERMLGVDWSVAGFSAANQIRIALHAGPVFRDFDPIAGRDGYFGSSVTRAARIEPVTPPGTVYASEAFAATLAATGGSAYRLEYVGKVALAKSYGESRIYRLERW